MALVKERTIRFDFTDDGVEVKGAGSVSLPTIEQKTTTVSGSGIMGEYETPILGQLNAMELVIDLTHVEPAAAARLKRPGIHEIVVYIAYQMRETTTDEILVQKERVSIRCKHKTAAEGTVNSDGDDNGSAAYSVSVYKKYVNGELTCDVEPLNSIYLWNGVDYYAPVRAALDL